MRGADVLKLRMPNLACGLVDGNSVRDAVMLVKGGRVTCSPAI